MKKILLALAILLIANPAWAGLTITATQPDDCNTVQISYDMDDTDSNLPRAFALEISLDNDANMGPVTYVNPEFYVYPGSIVITGGVVTNYGTPVAESDISSMTIEMGSLYAAEDPCHTSPPAENGTLLKFMVQNDKDCNVSLAQNAIRGGVVMEDTTQEFSPSYVTLVGCQVDSSGCSGECFPSGHADYQAWLDRSSPPSWCNPRQCHGDADGLQETRGKNDFWVGYPDLDLFLAGFPITTTTYVDEATHPWIAADFDHDTETRGKNKFYIGYPDLDIFLASFPIPGEGIATDCLDVP
jgi:hypothetical protein